MARTTLQNPTLSDRGKSAAPLSEYRSSSRLVGLLLDDIEYRRLYARYLAWKHRVLPDLLERQLPIEVKREIEVEREAYARRIERKTIQRTSRKKLAA